MAKILDILYRGPNIEIFEILILHSFIFSHVLWPNRSEKKYLTKAEQVILYMKYFS